MLRTPLPIILLLSVVAGCAWHAHAGASVSPAASPSPPVPAPTTLRKVDEYGNIRWRDEMARLDNLAVELRNDPTAVAYLSCYGARKARVGEARKRCERAANYLKKAHRIEAARVHTSDKGFREELTVELWALPAGSALPTASPTVDPSEVTFIKDAPARKRRPRTKR